MTKNISSKEKISPLKLPLMRRIETEFCVEMSRKVDGAYVVLIGGVHRILEYKSDEMTFSCKGAVVSVLGEFLICESFQNGYIEVRGKVNSLLLR